MNLKLDKNLRFLEIYTYNDNVFPTKGMYNYKRWLMYKIQGTKRESKNLMLEVNG